MAVDKANAMDNCYESNNQGQTKMSYSGGQNKNVPCYNCNKHGHYSRDCKLPKRVRKEQRHENYQEDILGGDGRE